MLKLLKHLMATVSRVQIASKAVCMRWMTMSDQEKRQAQQRAFSVAVCAAAFAVGGPLVGHRIEILKNDESFHADAKTLNTRLARHDDGQARLRMHGAARLVNATFQEGAGPAWRSASSAGRRETAARFEAVAEAQQLNGVAGALFSMPGAASADAHSRDAAALRDLAAYDLLHFDSREFQRKELDCLAEAVYYEARSENVRGQIAVAEVVMNRVNDPHFPKTVCGVVYQGRYRMTGCQFTFTCDGSIRHRPRGPSWERARAVALHVQMGLAKPVTNNATHYHAGYVSPYWSAGLVSTGAIGEHIFYRFPSTQAEWAKAHDAMAARAHHHAQEGDAADDADLAPAEKTEAPSLMPISASNKDAAVDRANSPL